MGEGSDETSRQKMAKITTLVIIVLLSLAIVASLTYIMFGTTTAPDAHELDEIIDVTTLDNETAYVKLHGAAPDGYILVEVEDSDETAELHNRGDQARIDTEPNQTLRFTYLTTSESDGESETPLGEYDM